MPRFQPGDYVKAEFKDEATGESEWMWVVVDSCDDGEGVLFGRLDNEPLVGTGLRLGDELAVSYERWSSTGRRRSSRSSRAGLAYWFRSAARIMTKLWLNRHLKSPRNSSQFQKGKNAANLLKAS